MAGPGICVLCLADTCTSEVHPVFNPIAPYGYLLPDMYLFSDGRRRWLVYHKREDQTPCTSKVHGSG